MECTLIKRKLGFSGKMFWSLEIPFKTGFTVLLNEKHNHNRAKNFIPKEHHLRTTNITPSKTFVC